MNGIRPLLLFFALAFGLFVGLKAQQLDSTAFAPEDILWDGLDHYRLSYEEGQLVFSDPHDITGLAQININGENVELSFRKGRAVWDFPAGAEGQLLLIKTDGGHRLYHLSQAPGEPARLRHIPLWLSLLPPLIAIALALIFKEVVISLFVGVWTGAFLADGLRLSSPLAYLESFWRSVEVYVVQALSDGGHVSIIVFSMLIGGMVALISRNGGMAGIVEKLSRYARTRRSAQFITWLLGVAIFFDDYANTLIVGNTMRPVTDRFRISREKLAYLVDSTAAPIAAIAFITTWIGAELGYIGDGIARLEGFHGGSPYSIFIESLKYAFYPILTLLFILLLIRSGREYGPMLQAERRASQTGQLASDAGEESKEDLEDLSPVEGIKHRWGNAFIPVLGVILMTLYGLLVTGFENTYAQLGEAATDMRWSSIWAALGQEGFFIKLGTIIGQSDSYVALLWASSTGVLLALLLTLSRGIMKLGQSISTLITGFKTMLPALIILTLAWALAETTHELHTAEFLSSALANALNPYFLPAVIFVLAALISFSTGSSWSTMAILYPIAIPTTWAVCQAQGVNPDLSLELLYNVIAVVLGASVLGDHCSPISDTTILSSLASHCRHIDHVRTQLPYALTVGSVSIVCCTLATLLGGHWGISALIGLVGTGLLAGIIWKVGRPIG